MNDYNYQPRRKPTRRKPTKNTSSGGTRQAPPRQHQQARRMPQEQNRQPQRPRHASKTNPYPMGQRVMPARAKKRKSKKPILIPVVALILIAGVGLGFFFASTNDNATEPASASNTPNGKNGFALEGAAEQTLIINSRFEDPGTTLDSNEIEVEGTVDTSAEGTYTLTYTHMNQTLERKVTVVDNKQIVMNLNGDRNTQVKQGQTYIESGAHAIDQDEGNLSERIESSGSVDTSTPGKYEVVYTVSNKDGLTCSRVRTVTVVPEDEFVARSNGFPVLMYHWVYTEDDMPDELNNNYILNTKLESHLQYLTENNYYYPSYQELYAYVRGEIDLPEKSVILAFDDGQRGFLNYGIPLLEQYQVPATSFVIAGNDNAESIIKQYASEYISFQNHTYDMHRGGSSEGQGGIIYTFTKDEIVDDLRIAQGIVQNTEALAYPYGDNNTTAQEAVVEAGILCAFTVVNERIYPGENTAALPRVRINGDIELEGFIWSVE